MDGKNGRGNRSHPGIGDEKTSFDGPVRERIERLKELVDLTDVISEDVRLVNGKGLCPMHDDHQPSLVVRKDRWQCLGACHTSGDVLDWLQKAKGMTFAQAMQDLERRAGQTPRQPSINKSPRPVITPKRKFDKDKALVLARTAANCADPVKVDAARVSLYSMLVQGANRP